MFGKEENVFSFIIDIISALIAAAGIAAAFYAGIIETILVLVYITLIIGAIALLAILFANIFNEKNECRCLNNIGFIATIIGSIVVSAFGIAATALPTASIAVGILIGAIAFFLILNLINIAKVIICEICDRRCR